MCSAARCYLAEGGFNINAWNLLPYLLVEEPPAEAAPLCMGGAGASVLPVLVMDGREGVERRWASET